VLFTFLSHARLRDNLTSGKLSLKQFCSLSSNVYITLRVKIIPPTVCTE